MQQFATLHLPAKRDAVAPDGSDVRILLALESGSMAHFGLAPGGVSIPVAHHTVDEIWYFIGGAGEMWRRQGETQEIVRVESGVCITIPCGTRFQFRALGSEPLCVIGVTMPQWPGEGEAYEVPGRWTPTLPRAAAAP